MINVKINRKHKRINRYGFLNLITVSLLLCIIIIISIVTYHNIHIYKMDCRVIQTEDCYVYAIDKNQDIWCFKDFRLTEDDWVNLVIDNNLTKTKSDDIVVKVNPLY